MALPGDLASDGSFKRNFSRRWYRENFSRVRPRETFHCCGVVGHTCRTGPSTAETDRRVHAAAAEIQLVPWRQTSRRPPRGLAGRARLWRGTRAVSLLSGVNRGPGDTCRCRRAAARCRASRWQQEGCSAVQECRRGAGRQDRRQRRFCSVVLWLEMAAVAHVVTPSQLTLDTGGDLAGSSTAPLHGMNGARPDTGCTLPPARHITQAAADRPLKGHIMQSTVAAGRSDVVGGGHAHCSH